MVKREPKKTRKPAAKKPAKTVPVKSRSIDEAVAFLRTHTEYQGKSGRELMSIRLNGKKVSYKTWNEAKKRLND